MMKYEYFVRDSFGNNLEVLQELPDKGDVFPTVVMVSGFGADLHEYGLFDEISTLLVKNGFQTIRFCFEGTGKSDGEFVTMTMLKQAQQLKDILNECVLKDRFADKSRIGLYAQSFGTATTVAALPLPMIRTFMFSSATADPQDSLGRLFRRQRGYNPEGISKRERSDNKIIKIGPEFWQDLRRHNLIGLIRKLSQPILFVHGTKDKKVKARESLLYFDAVKSRKKFQVIELADHAFTGRFRAAFLGVILDWFEETLR